MRKKLNEIRNKEEGFTLVELLAVIVILGIIMAIAVPSIGNVISQSKTKAEAADEALIVDAARLAVISENVDVTENRSVTVAVLIASGYLELPAGRTEIAKKEGGVNITKKGKKYDYVAAAPTVGAITEAELTGTD